MKHFLAAFASLPEGAQHLRKRHFEAFLRDGLPSKAQEDWRYTDLSPLAERPLTLAAPVHPRLPSLAGAEAVSFANGRLVGGDKKLTIAAVPDLTQGPVTALNAAFSMAGLELEVMAGVQRPPLHLITWFGGTDNGMAHLRHRIRLAPGASLQLILQELGPPSSADETGRSQRQMPGDGPFFATQMIDIELAANSQLELYRLQQFAAGTTALTRLDVRLAGDARFRSVGLYAGGALVRNDVNVALEAPGADAELHGVMVPGMGEHLDVHTRLDHRAAHGRSREMFRCIVPARARAIFNGKVIVHPGAAKTDSEQHVDSLLLAPGAEVNAKPELQIDADDVKCAHGATCGQLDEDVIYYLRTRGLDLAAARNVLLYTFAREVLARIGFEPARQLAEQALLARLPGAASLGELG
jgi:Fe-S cluster assembly protein SufD